MLAQPEVLHDDPELFARERIERGERLVEHQELGLVNQRAAQVGALLHAAGKLPGIFRAKSAQANQVEQALGPRSVLVAVLPALALERLHDLQRQHHVVQSGAPRHQGGVLKCHADALDGTGHHLAIDRNRSRAGR